MLCCVQLPHGTKKKKPLLPGLTIEFLLRETSCWASNGAQQAHWNSDCLCWHGDQHCMLGAIEYWILIFQNQPLLFYIPKVKSKGF